MANYEQSSTGRAPDCQGLGESRQGDFRPKAAEAQETQLAAFLAPQCPHGALSPLRDKGWHEQDSAKGKAEALAARS